MAKTYDDIAVGTQFKKGGKIFTVRKIERGLVALQASGSKYMEEVRINHLRTCSLYKKVEKVEEVA
jgi:hypothetical protein